MLWQKGVLEDELLCCVFVQQLDFWLCGMICSVFDGCYCFMCYFLLFEFNWFMMFDVLFVCNDVELFDVVCDLGEMCNFVIDCKWYGELLFVMNGCLNDLIDSEVGDDSLDVMLICDGKVQVQICKWY